MYYSTLSLCIVHVLNSNVQYMFVLFPVVQQVVCLGGGYVQHCRLMDSPICSGDGVERMMNCTSE